MKREKLSNDTTTAIAKGIKAHLSDAGVEVTHTMLLAGIARGLGFDSVQAMRALGREGQASGCETTKVSAAGFRTSFLVELLSDENDVSESLDLETIAYRMNEGDCVGRVVHIHTEPLEREELARACTEFGSTGDFFQIFDKPDVEEMRRRLEKAGWHVGARDPQLNTRHAGAFMCAEPYEKGVTTSQDGQNGPWCVVGDDLESLVSEAYEWAFG